MMHVDQAPVTDDTAPFPEEQARADLHAIAARLLLRAPDEAFLAALAGAAPLGEAGIASPLRAAWQGLVHAARTIPAGQVAAEYAALFEATGSPLLDPHESKYLTGFMMEKPLAALRDDLACLGIAHSRGTGLPEDHLGALCEVMRLLIVGAGGLPPQPLARQRWFFERHLDCWTDRCLDDIAAAEPAVFYRQVARFVRALLALEREGFALLPPDGDATAGPIHAPMEPTTGACDRSALPTVIRGETR
jgi:TorA maturation chaperone TorD